MTSKQELKLELAFPYDIHITPTVNGGCIVNVGCAQLSYSTPARMVQDLKKYLADPEEYEKAYYECNKAISHISGEPTVRGGLGRRGPDDDRENRCEPDRPRTDLVAGSGHVVERLPETDQGDAKEPDENAETLDKIAKLADSEGDNEERTEPG